MQFVETMKNAKLTYLFLLGVLPLVCGNHHFEHVYNPWNPKIERELESLLRSVYSTDSSRITPVKNVPLVMNPSPLSFNIQPQRFHYTHTIDRDDNDPNFIILQPFDPLRKNVYPQNNREISLTRSVNKNTGFTHFLKRNGDLFESKVHNKATPIRHLENDDFFPQHDTWNNMEGWSIRKKATNPSFPENVFFKRNGVLSEIKSSYKTPLLKQLGSGNFATQDDNGKALSIKETELDLGFPQREVLRKNGDLPESKRDQKVSLPKLGKKDITMQHQAEKNEKVESIAQKGTGPSEEAFFRKTGDVPEFKNHDKTPSLKHLENDDFLKQHQDENDEKEWSTRQRDTNSGISEQTFLSKIGGLPESKRFDNPSTLKTLGDSSGSHKDQNNEEVRTTTQKETNADFSQYSPLRKNGDLPESKKLDDKILYLKRKENDFPKKHKIQNNKKVSSAKNGGKNFVSAKQSSLKSSSDFSKRKSHERTEPWQHFGNGLKLTGTELIESFPQLHYHELYRIDDILAESSHTSPVYHDKDRWNVEKEDNRRASAYMKRSELQKRALPNDDTIHTIHKLDSPTILFSNESSDRNVANENETSVSNQSEMSDTDLLASQASQIRRTTLPPLQRKEILRYFSHRFDRINSIDPKTSNPKSFTSRTPFLSPTKRSLGGKLEVTQKPLLRRRMLRSQDTLNTYKPKMESELNLDHILTTEESVTLVTPERSFVRKTVFTSPDTPHTEASIPLFKTPETKIPEMKIPEIKIPEMRIPEIKIPGMKISETDRWQHIYNDTIKLKSSGGGDAYVTSFRIMGNVHMTPLMKDFFGKTDDHFRTSYKERTGDSQVTSIGKGDKIKVPLFRRKGENPSLRKHNITRVVESFPFFGNKNSSQTYDNEMSPESLRNKSGSKETRNREIFPFKDTENNKPPQYPRYTSLQNSTLSTKTVTDAVSVDLDVNHSVTNNSDFGIFRKKFGVRSNITKGENESLLNPQLKNVSNNKHSFNSNVQTYPKGNSNRESLVGSVPDKHIPSSVQEFTSRNVYNATKSGAKSDATISEEREHTFSENNGFGSRLQEKNGNTRSTEKQTPSPRRKINLPRTKFISDNASHRTDTKFGSAAVETDKTPRRGVNVNSKRFYQTNRSEPRKNIRHSNTSSERSGLVKTADYTPSRQNRTSTTVKNPEESRGSLYQDGNFASTSGKDSLGITDVPDIIPSLDQDSDFKRNENHSRLNQQFYGTSSTGNVDINNKSNNRFYPRNQTRLVVPKRGRVSHRSNITDAVPPSNTNKHVDLPRIRKGNSHSRFRNSSRIVPTGVSRARDSKEHHTNTSRAPHSIYDPNHNVMKNPNLNKQNYSGEVSTDLPVSRDRPRKKLRPAARKHIDHNINHKQIDENVSNRTRSKGLEPVYSGSGSNTLYTTTVAPEPVSSNTRVQEDDDFDGDTRSDEDASNSGEDLGTFMEKERQSFLDYRDKFENSFSEFFALQNNGQQRSTNDQQRPTTGQQRPINGQPRPTNGRQQRPTNGRQRPTNGRQRPTNGQQRPTNGQQRPRNSPPVHDDRFSYNTQPAHDESFSGYKTGKTPQTQPMSKQGMSYKDAKYEEEEEEDMITPSGGDNYERVPHKVHSIKNQKLYNGKSQKSKLQKNLWDRSQSKPIISKKLGDRETSEEIETEKHPHNGEGKITSLPPKSASYHSFGGTVHADDSSHKEKHPGTVNLENKEEDTEVSTQAILKDIKKYNKDGNNESYLSTVSGDHYPYFDNYQTSDKGNSSTTDEKNLTLPPNYTTIRANNPLVSDNKESFYVPNHKVFNSRNIQNISTEKPMHYSTEDERLRWHGQNLTNFSDKKFHKDEGESDKESQSRSFRSSTDSQVTTTVTDNPSTKESGDKTKTEIYTKEMYTGGYGSSAGRNKDYYITPTTSSEDRTNTEAYTKEVRTGGYRQLFDRNRKYYNTPTASSEDRTNTEAYTKEVRTAGYRPLFDRNRKYYKTTTASSEDRTNTEAYTKEARTEDYGPSSDKDYYTTPTTSSKNRTNTEIYTKERRIGDLGPSSNRNKSYYITPPASSEYTTNTEVYTKELHTGRYEPSSDKDQNHSITPTTNSEDKTNTEVYTKELHTGRYEPSSDKDQNHSITPTTNSEDRTNTEIYTKEIRTESSRSSSDRDKDYYITPTSSTDITNTDIYKKETYSGGLGSLSDKGKNHYTTPTISQDRTSTETYTKEIPTRSFGTSPDSSRDYYTEPTKPSSRASGISQYQKDDVWESHKNSGDRNRFLTRKGSLPQRNKSVLPGSFHEEDELAWADKFQVKDLYRNSGLTKTSEAEGNKQERMDRESSIVRQPLSYGTTSFHRWLRTNNTQQRRKRSVRVIKKVVLKKPLIRRMDEESTDDSRKNATRKIIRKRIDKGFMNLFDIGLKNMDLLRTRPANLKKYNHFLTTGRVLEDLNSTTGKPVLVKVNRVGPGSGDSELVHWTWKTTLQQDEADREALSKGSSQNEKNDLTTVPYSRDISFTTVSLQNPTSKPVSKEKPSLDDNNLHIKENLKTRLSINDLFEKRSKELEFHSTHPKVQKGDGINAEIVPNAKKNDIEIHSDQSKKEQKNKNGGLLVPRNAKHNMTFVSKIFPLSEDEVTTESRTIGRVSDTESSQDTKGTKSESYRYFHKYISDEKRPEQKSPEKSTREMTTSNWGYDKERAVQIAKQAFYPNEVDFEKKSQPYRQAEKPQKWDFSKLPDFKVPKKDNFPRYHTIPKTSFSCKKQKHPGYYADPETDCQVFHFCHENGMRNSFLCPNSSVFNQKILVCDWWNNVDCEGSEKNNVWGIRTKSGHHGITENELQGWNKDSPKITGANQVPKTGIKEFVTGPLGKQNEDFVGYSYTTRSPSSDTREGNFESLIKIGQDNQSGPPFGKTDLDHQSGPPFVTYGPEHQSGQIFGKTSSDYQSESLFGKTSGQHSTRPLFGKMGSDHQSGSLFSKTGGEHSTGSLFVTTGPERPSGQLFSKAGPDYQTGPHFVTTDPDHHNGPLFGKTVHEHRTGSHFVTTGPEHQSEPPFYRDVTPSKNISSFTSTKKANTDNDGADAYREDSKSWKIKSDGFTESDIIENKGNKNWPTTGSDENYGNSKTTSTDFFSDNQEGKNLGHYNSEKSRPLDFFKSEWKKGTLEDDVKIKSGLSDMVSEGLKVNEPASYSDSPIKNIYHTGEPKINSSFEDTGEIYRDPEIPFITSPHKKVVFITNKERTRIDELVDRAFRNLKKPDNLNMNHDNKGKVSDYDDLKFRREKTSEYPAVKYTDFEEKPDGPNTKIPIPDAGTKAAWKPRDEMNDPNKNFDEHAYGKLNPSLKKPSDITFSGGEVNRKLPYNAKGDNPLAKERKTLKEKKVFPEVKSGYETFGEEAGGLNKNMKIEYPVIKGNVKLNLEDERLIPKKNIHLDGHTLDKFNPGLDSPGHFTINGEKFKSSLSYNLKQSNPFAKEQQITGYPEVKLGPRDFDDEPVQIKTNLNIQLPKVNPSVGSNLYDKLKVPDVNVPFDGPAHDKFIPSSEFPLDFSLSADKVNGKQSHTTRGGGNLFINGRKKFQQKIEYPEVKLGNFEDKQAGMNKNLKIENVDISPKVEFKPHDELKGKNHFGFQTFSPGLENPPDFTLSGRKGEISDFVKEDKPLTQAHKKLQKKIYKAVARDKGSNTKVLAKQSGHQENHKKSPLSYSSYDGKSGIPQEFTSSRKENKTEPFGYRKEVSVEIKNPEFTSLLPEKNIYSGKSEVRFKSKNAEEASGDVKKDKYIDLVPSKGKSDDKKPRLQTGKNSGGGLRDTLPQKLKSYLGKSTTHEEELSPDAEKSRYVSPLPPRRERRRKITDDINRNYSQEVRQSVKELEDGTVTSPGWKDKGSDGVTFQSQRVNGESSKKSRASDGGYVTTVRPESKTSQNIRQDDKSSMSQKVASGKKRCPSCDKMIESGHRDISEDRDFEPTFVKTKLPGKIYKFGEHPHSLKRRQNNFPEEYVGSPTYEGNTSPSFGPKVQVVRIPVFGKGKYQKRIVRGKRIRISGDTLGNYGYPHSKFTGLGDDALHVSDFDYNEKRRKQKDNIVLKNLEMQLTSKPNNFDEGNEGALEVVRGRNIKIVGLDPSKERKPRVKFTKGFNEDDYESFELIKNQPIVGSLGIVPELTDPYVVNFAKDRFGRNNEEIRENYGLVKPNQMMDKEITLIELNGEKAKQHGPFDVVKAEPIVGTVGIIPELSDPHTTDFAKNRFGYYNEEMRENYDLVKKNKMMDNLELLRPFDDEEDDDVKFVPPLLSTEKENTDEDDLSLGKSGPHGGALKQFWLTKKTGMQPPDAYVIPNDGEFGGRKQKIENVVVTPYPTTGDVSEEVSTESPFYTYSYTDPKTEVNRIKGRNESLKSDPGVVVLRGGHSDDDSNSDEVLRPGTYQFPTDSREKRGKERDYSELERAVEFETMKRFKSKTHKTTG